MDFQNRTNIYVPKTDIKTTEAYHDLKLCYSAQKFMQNLDRIEFNGSGDLLNFVLMLLQHLTALLCSMIEGGNFLCRAR